ncbi:uncharacterized protein LOC112555185 [Pomacea canaliculata]|uniref:uncharacterized protein LOC112555185 n=1 Tax=Pomacea canaliculata TaxID=400727 RepID=UPI000D725E9C|nr:uncharacterized protein LOC112555185 [Pomacea canaliculata]
MSQMCQHYKNKLFPILCLLFFVLQENVTSKTATSYGNKWEEKHITEKVVLPFTLESSSLFNFKHTDRYVSVETGEDDKSDNVVTHVHGVSNTSSATEPLASVNTFDDLTTSLPSPHWHLQLQECANHSHIYPVKGSEGSILISFTPTDDSQTYSVVLSCTIELQVPQGMLAHVWLSTGFTGGIHSVILTDEDNVVIFNDFVINLPTKLFTYSNILRLQLVMSGMIKAFQINVNFTAVPQGTRPQLTTTFLSSTTGYIDTTQPRENREYRPFINTWTYLVAPEDHATVINIYIYDGRIDCLFHGLTFLIIFQTNLNSKQYDICALHKHSYTEPVLYHGGVRVQYKSFTRYPQPFFRIQFSFHHVSALPVQLSEGRWNCSAVRWEDMQHHFPCNFVSNCVGGEDEAGCWSGDGTCSPGTLQADGRCFSLSFLVEEEMSWINAHEQCQKRGGQLPSLSTKQVWESVTDLFVRTDECSCFFIGARSAPPTISVMYRNSWMWSDDTIAHFIKLYTLALSRFNTDLCTSLWNLIRTFDKIPLLMRECQDSYAASCLLCEIPGTSSLYEHNKLPEIRTISTPNFSKVTLCTYFL